MQSLSCPTKALETEKFVMFSLERLICDFTRYAVAESDCNLAIALDRNYIKAYARRGAARFALHSLESALEGELIEHKMVPWQQSAAIIQHPQIKYFTNIYQPVGQESFITFKHTLFACVCYK